MNKYLITGASGNIGRYVVDELISSAKNVKAAVHDREKGNKLFKDKENVELVEFDFLDEKTFEEALEGVRAIFLVRPPKLAKPQKDMRPFLEAAKKMGIKKIVFVSLLGVEKNPIVPHRKIEDMIKKLDIPYVFLRPSFFMQNLNTNHREEIKERNELYIPAGSSKTSFIDTRDIARTAAISLIDEKYTNTTLTLTGKKAIDYYEVSRILSDVLKKEITYKDPSLYRFRKDRIKRGTSKGFATVMTLLYLMTKLGTAKDVTYDLEKIIGRAPISFKQYAIDHKNYWI